ncbi:MAG: hypothetical protein JXA58_08385 [Dehalococcoidia bacterium]|nr:hypothetical protein [Dehalococcoidia bacterium]
MKSGFMLLGLTTVAATCLSGCAGGISQEVYDAAVSGRESAETRADRAESELSALQDSCAGLETELDVANDSLAQCLEHDSAESCGESTLEAWEATWKRHERIRQDVPERGHLLDLAPWMVFPEAPDWLGDTTICAIELEPDKDGTDSYCLMEAPEREMLVKVRVEESLVSMLCLGGESDYVYTVTTGNDGRIVQQMFMAGDDYAQLEWVGPEKMERFVALYNDIEYTNLFPVNEGEHEKMFDSFVDWVFDVGADGGLIRESDRPLAIVGLGQLRGLPYAGLTLSEPEALKRAFADLVFGIPAGSLPLRSAS